MVTTSDVWTAVVIGNSRHHWGVFHGAALVQCWHLAPEDVLPPELRLVRDRECWGVSVGRTPLEQLSPNATRLSLADIPMPQLYPTLGLDRALALWGALQVYGAPVCVVDAGTALTFTLADTAGAFAGGAILPGAGMMARALADGTAALPLVPIPQQVPPRWAVTTPSAIESGLYFGMAAIVQSYLGAFYATYPRGTVLITGGDRAFIESLVATDFAGHAWHTDEHLAFWGIRAIRNQQLR
ncbi:pantothenate kinase [Thermosynechococcaceae cyanobacterium Okahandja]